METLKIISGNTEQELWPEVEADLADGAVYEYNVLIKQGNKETDLLIDIDPGGGFESGWENTVLKAPINVNDDLRFAIHDQTFIDKAGKFFGMDDVEIGYGELDKHLVVKTNDVNRLHNIFSDATVRSVLVSLNSFHCGIHTYHDDHTGEQAYLELNVDEGINEAAPLRNLYHAFYSMLVAIEHTSPVS